MPIPNSNFEPAIVYNSVRDYQRDAIDNTIAYIEKFDPKKSDSHLIAMPTGSGKTAIMALLSRCYKPIGGIVLIVSPRVAVSEQLNGEIGGLFFSKKLGLTDTIPKSVRYYENFTVTEETDDLVLVTTIQKIDFYQRARRNKFAKEYQLLLKKVKMVIFDEGHYEPAISWSQAIRKFRCPRIIFTATPFRNDFKGFDINWNKAFFLSYKEILEKGYLREVIFEDIEKKPDNNTKFLDDVIEKYRTNFPGANGKTAKIIINCDNALSILRLGMELLKKNISFIAIHETFDHKFLQGEKHSELKTHLAQKVPPHPEDSETIIWIHQYKLLEGIDDPSFHMLVIYEPLRSIRGLIQQIGRIIRNPSRQSHKAFVYNYSDRLLKAEWEKYLKLDEHKNFTKNFSETVYKTVDNALDDIAYLDKKFREKLNQKSFQGWELEELKKQINLPLKVNLLQRFENFNFKAFIEKAIEKRFAEEDHIFYKNQIDDKTYFYYYFTIANSDYLEKSYFPNIAQDVCLIRDLGEYLAFYDSSGFDPSGNDELGIGLAIEPSMLYRLFNDKDDTIFNRVYLKNGNLGSHDLRNHSFSAPSIAQTTPFLNDHAHFMGSTFGVYSDNRTYKESYKKMIKAGKKPKPSQIRTYIGFSKGRVSQNDFNYVSIKEYLDWLTYMDEMINDKKRMTNVFFNRYAYQLSALEDDQKVPINILIDLADLENDIAAFADPDENDNSGPGSNEPTATEKLPRETIPWSELIPDSCIDVEVKLPAADEDQQKIQYYFLLNIAGETNEVTIRFEPKTKKYILECFEIKIREGMEFKSTGRTVDFISYLNRKQCFRILTETRLIYAHGYFYNPSLKFGPGFEEDKFPLAHIIHAVPPLNSISSEKGKVSVTGNGGWEKESLFAFIDRFGKDDKDMDTIFTQLFGTPQTLICTDLNTEVADFIAVYADKLILMHVKGNGNDTQKAAGKYSATNLGEVCNQAIKNVHYLSIFDNSKPKNLDTWLAPYSVINSKHGINIQVNDRLRQFQLPRPTTPEEVWEQIEAVKFSGSSEKEIWIVLGRLFSRNAFMEQLKKEKPAAEAIQAALTLQNAMASISSVGARLRIFCSP